MPQSKFVATYLHDVIEEHFNGAISGFAKHFRGVNGTSISDRSVKNHSSGVSTPSEKNVVRYAEAIAVLTGRSFAEEYRALTQPQERTDSPRNDETDRSSPRIVVIVVVLTLTFVAALVPLSRQQSHVNDWPNLKEHLEELLVGQHLREPELTFRSPTGNDLFGSQIRASGEVTVVDVKRQSGEFVVAESDKGSSSIPRAKALHLEIKAKGRVTLKRQITVDFGTKIPLLDPEGDGAKTNLWAVDSDVECVLKLTLRSQNKRGRAVVTLASYTVVCESNKDEPESDRFAREYLLSKRLLSETRQALESYGLVIEFDSQQTLTPEP